MKDFKGVCRELYNKYRFEFVGMEEKDPKLFELMMQELLTSYNAYCTGEYQNYFTSNVYQNKKRDLYEILFRTYAKLRMGKRAEFKNLKSGESSLKEFLQVNAALLGYSLSGARHADFRRDRQFGVVYAVCSSYCDDKSLSYAEEIAFAINQLDEMAASINKDARARFEALTNEEKTVWFEEKKAAALNRLDERHQVVDSKGSEI